MTIFDKMDRLPSNVSSQKLFLISTVHRPCPPHLQARQVPAGLHLPASRAHQARAHFHCHPGVLPGRALGHQIGQVRLNYFPHHGE